MILHIYLFCYKGRIYPFNIFFNLNTGAVALFVGVCKYVLQSYQTRHGFLFALFIEQ